MLLLWSSDSRECASQAVGELWRRYVMVLRKGEIELANYFVVLAVF